MTWKYLPVLNACIQILFTVGLGAVLGKFGVFKLPFVAAMVKFVFHVGLPCLVVNALAVVIDFYSDKYIWKYICAFLILRVITLVFAFASLLLHHDRANVGIGDVAVRWLCLSWISTVILGVPIMTSVFNDPTLGQKYGVLAAISSFIFQLPVQLFFLECHKVENQSKRGSDHTHEQHDDEGSVPSMPVAPKEDRPEEFEMENVDFAVAAEEGQIEECPSNSDEVAVKALPANKWALVASLSTSKEMWTKIGLQVLRNPVLWGIFFGFVLSLSTFGVKYLRPMNLEAKPPVPNEDYVEGLKWLTDMLVWLGNTVSPISLFAMGVWMQDQGPKLVNIGMVQLSLFMISKIVLVPLLMVGLSAALNLDDEQGRSAVLIATLPISLASFSLGKKYDIGEDVLSANVAVGTLLMLPGVIVWNAVMDEIGLYDNFVVKA